MAIWRRRKGATADCLFDLVGNPRIERTVTLLNVREPICHSDNSLDYSAKYVNYHQDNDSNRCIGVINEYNRYNLFVPPGAKSVACSSALLGGDYSQQRESVLRRLWGFYCELAAKRRGRLALGK